MADGGEPAHAKFSPSGAHRRVECVGSMAMEEGYPDTSSDSSDEGTAAHTVASMTLEGKHPSTQAFLGRRIDVRPGKTVECDQEMCEEVQKYVDFVRACEVTGLTLMVEQKVCFEPSLGLDPGEGWGTSDGILIGDTHLTVIDLKYGANPNNKVLAEDNYQMMEYALGVLDTFDLWDEIKTLTLVIHQPRLNHVDPWNCTIEHLRAYAKKAATAAIDSKAAIRTKHMGKDISKAYLNPGKKQCQWCKAKATCPALQAYVQDAVGAQFDDLTKGEVVNPEGPVVMGDNHLSVAMGAIDLIEDFCKAVRAEVERRLLAGKPVDGYKLVGGRKGARAWTDEGAAEALLKQTFRLPVDDIYDKKLVSPTKAEKLLKDSPQRWSKVSVLIGQSEGKPSVAPASDKRAAWTPMQFDNVEEIA